MGSRRSVDQLAGEDEEPQHRVYLPAYRISRTPVTVEQFATFARATCHRTVPNATIPLVWYQPRGEGSRVERASQASRHSDKVEDAVAFADGPVLAAHRGGVEKARAQMGASSLGNDWDPKKANASDGGPGRTTPVGACALAGDSPYGCVDMAGNLWEWTSSLYEPYPYKAGDGREDPEAEGARVVRGSSWYIRQRRARCAFRYGAVPGLFNDNIGFRVVLSRSS
jgi:formylglycine-generating enzyme required for sulfatase activity